MDPEDYTEKALLNLSNNGYEKVDSSPEFFPEVYHKTITASNLDAGRERRFIGLAQVDEVEISTIRGALEELENIGKDNIVIDNAAADAVNFTSMPLIPAFVSSDVSDDMKSTVSDMDTVTGSNIRVPIIVDLSGGGGLRGPDFDLTYPLPKRRHLPRRRSVKKLVSTVFEDV